MIWVSLSLSLSLLVFVFHHLLSFASILLYLCLSVLSSAFYLSVHQIYHTTISPHFLCQYFISSTHFAHTQQHHCNTAAASLCMFAHDSIHSCKASSRLSHRPPLVSVCVISWWSLFQGQISPSTHSVGLWVAVVSCFPLTSPVVSTGSHILFCIG